MKKREEELEGKKKLKNSELQNQFQYVLSYILGFFWAHNEKENFSTYKAKESKYGHTIQESRPF